MASTTRGQPADDARATQAFAHSWRVGLLATYGPLLTDTIGVVAFIAAGVLLLLGMVFRRI